MIDVRKRPMCWLAIGFLLIICCLMLGRSAKEIMSEQSDSEDVKNYLDVVEQNETVILEGNIVSKEYKEYCETRLFRLTYIIIYIFDKKINIFVDICEKKCYNIGC